MKLKLLAAAAIVATAVPANATLLVNGNFDANLAGWSVDRIGGATGFVSTNSIFFNLAAPAAQFRTGVSNFYTLSQSVVTTIGERYRLTYFALNQNNTLNQLDVTTGDTTTSTSFESPFEGFTSFTQEFVATSESSLVQFAVNHGGVGGNFFFIDDVSLVNIVPEPESWALLIAGFGLVGAAARRRRQGRVHVA